ncbi:KAP family P-loop NTPase fold protein [Marinilactibacillus psychrotolerans]|uniref:KAP family P-loop NTPase fold protein n=1 Tax=Marinilactibacillus psychrotolerans TaxID=191770 RepID=UPI00388E7137
MMWRDSETELDYLDFDYLIETVSNIIKNDDLLPSTIGVYGDWGSGKSSLINMSIASLKDNKDTECIYFNGWLFEDYEDAKTALLGNILDTIERNRTLGDNAKKCIAGLYKSIDKMKLVKSAIRLGGAFLTGGSSFVAEFAISNALDNMLPSKDGIVKEDLMEAIKSELTDKELREDINSFRDNFDKLLKETQIDRLVVFIDELDRCSPDTILDTLEAIRLFLYVGRTAFIIGADERHISYAVQTKFKEIEGTGIDIGKEYLEKIVQYPVRIPRLSTREVELYISLLFMEKDLSKEEFKKTIEFIDDKKTKNFFDFQLDYGLIKGFDEDIADKVKLSLEISKQLSSVLANGLNGNPRHCKRFLNSMEMRLNMAQYKTIELDRKILAKIMMLEYFKPRMFAELVSAPVDLAGKIIELSTLENKESESLEKLVSWKDDEWVKAWLDMQPAIGEEDLRPYFYFARTTLDNRYEMSKMKLSKIANDVLRNLIAGTDSGIRSACDKAKEVNEYEAALIIEHLISRISSSSDISDIQLRSLLEWGAFKKEVHTEIINGLDAVSGTRIKPSHIPRVMNFGKEINQTQRVDEIFDSWIKNNQALKTFIDAERGN